MSIDTNRQHKTKLWNDLWLLLKPYRGRIYILLAIIIVMQILVLAGPYLFKLIIDTITGFSPELLPVLGLYVGLYFFVEEITNLIDYFKDRRLIWLAFNIESYLNSRAQSKLVNLPLDYHEQENTGNKIVKVERGVQRILDLVMNLTWEVVPTLLQLLFTVIVMFLIDYRLAFSILVFAPLFILITYRVNKSVSPMRKYRHEKHEQASGRLGQMMININTVKSFVQEMRETREYRGIRQTIVDKGTYEWFKVAKFSWLRGMINNFGRFVVLVLGVYFLVKGSITIGTLVFILTISETAYKSLWRLSRIYDRIEEGAVAVNRLIKIFDEKSSIINKPDGIVPRSIKGAIEFKGLTFVYRESRITALDNVSLRINSGCVTALVGPSGGGKTTLARMIYRHYDPMEGQVIIDGHDIREYDLYSLRKFISIVPQEVEIFNTSVRNNIAYANPEASFEEIQAAARISNSEEFILRLKEKYDTEVGERGVKLSGGQRQRIGIARAILANPRILIFDEATSNLDSESEKMIQEAMSKITKGRTTIVIAHRLSTINRADKIIVLENGQVMEQGSHFELSSKRGGLYAKLLKLQQTGEVE